MLGRKMARDDHGKIKVRAKKDGIERHREGMSQRDIRKRIKGRSQVGSQHPMTRQARRAENHGGPKRTQEKFNKHLRKDEEVRFKCWPPGNKQDNIQDGRKNYRSLNIKVGKPQSLSQISEMLGAVRSVRRKQIRSRLGCVFQ